MTEYCSVKEMATKFGVSARRVQTLCEQNRIQGATRISGVWLIPKDTKKPQDARIHEPKRVKTTDSSDEKNTLLSLKQVCEQLSISQATGRNWIKSGKLKPTSGGAGKYYFLQSDILKMQQNFISGKDDKLKSRRNKKYITGIKTYQGYIEEQASFKAVTQLAKVVHDNIEHPYQLKIILAEYALQLLCSAKSIPTKQKSQLLALYCNGELTIGKYQPLIEDFLKDIPERMRLVKQYEALFGFELPYAKGQDSLGLLYLSLRGMGERKETGAYYTPISVVRTVVDKLVSENVLDEKKTICDPCCGTGNFLIYALQFQSDVEKIFGQDLDELSVQIARVNLCLACEVEDINILYQNIRCEDSLQSKTQQTYDIILGNPPWGYRYTQDYLKELSSDYQTITQNGTESFALFLEHGLQQCVADGVVAFVLPEALCTVKNHQPIREILLQQSQITYVNYLQNIFNGVQCPAIILMLKRTVKPFTTKGIQVKTSTQAFSIQTNRNVTSEGFSFSITDQEYEVLQTMKSLENVAYLNENAEFALGIVTGDNKQHLKQEQTGKAEPVLKGSDICLFQIKSAENYIVFTPKNFQQVASERLYRAKEKLFYRFICERLVFAYDDCQMVSLNSCNIVIPQIKGLDMRYILAILNSDSIQFYFAKQFQSIKVLRSHIEQLPIPVIPKYEQQYFIERVEAIRNTTDQAEKEIVYQEINQAVMKLFGLTEKRYKIVVKTVIDSQKYL